MLSERFLSGVQAHPGWRTGGRLSVSSVWSEAALRKIPEESKEAQRD